MSLQGWQCEAWWEETIEEGRGMRGQVSWEGTGMPARGQPDRLYTRRHQHPAGHHRLQHNNSGHQAVQGSCSAHLLAVVLHNG